MRWNVGTSYPALEGVLIDHILVPDFRDAKYEELGRQAREAVEAPQRAKLLTKAAMADVEALIEGKLKEAQCLREGRALAEEFGLETP